MSTLEAVRLLVDTLSPRFQSFGRIAILNLANTIKPSGGILSGAPDQEGPIVRSSTMPFSFRPGFGTGAYRNNVETIVRIWEELFLGERAHFARSFHRVVIAILGKETQYTQGCARWLERHNWSCVLNCDFLMLLSKSKLVDILMRLF
jgi:hypothetical protein